MKTVAYLLILLLVGECTKPSKKDIGGKFGHIFQKADSVLIVSHEPTDGIELYDEQTGKSSKPAPLLIENRLNQHIIKESFRVTGPRLDTLASILARPKANRKIKTSRCFIPHHAIVVYARKSISYADICFSCRRIISSGEMNLFEGDFDDQKWKELMAFYQGYGVKYEVSGINFDEE
jgi:hypothetical protein